MLTYLGFISMFQKHKQCILSKLNSTALRCYPKKPCTLAGFEPGSAMSTAPRRHGKTRKGLTPGLRSFVPHDTVVMPG
jgi:hypothetical protein